ncbi:hypothetical protein N7450_007897 [Penicillium hetheringtonii]|uniref:Uncharacterized protein n=1 Tax=Penicillium hetheringtonii TaxID=911720 RepID=A0AAD6DGY6_9EURO|nr:hypothetical protein N7450_007897 [Penicillium hetheringtonii]
MYYEKMLRLKTDAYILLQYPRLLKLRMELRKYIEDMLDSISNLLGNSNEGKKDKPDTVSRAKTVQAVLGFAEASQRFRSRAQ